MNNNFVAKLLSKTSLLNQFGYKLFLMVYDECIV